MHRFVIIGPGYISRRYVEKISTMHHASVAAVVGRNADRTRRYAKQHGITAYGTDLKSVVNEIHPQSAIICTPNALHHEGVIAAANLGLHCLCEKPLDVSRQRQHSMIDACRRNGVKLGVAYIHRFHNHMQYIENAIKSGMLGDILVVDATMKIYRAPEYYTKSSWHGTRTLDGGGPFIQQGSHLVDMVLWLAGGYLEVLEARRFNILHDIEVEDHGYAVIEFKSGAVGMVQVSTACMGMTRQTIEISGSKGNIFTDLSKIIRYNIDGQTQPEFEPDEDLFSQLINDFIKAVETDREPFVTGESAMAATELVLDIYKKSGSPQRMLPRNG